MDPRRGEPVIIEDEWVITAWLTIKEWVESDPTHQCPTGEELWLLLELYSQQQKAGIEFDAGKIVAEVAKILEVSQNFTLSRIIELTEDHQQETQVQDLLVEG